ncbi:MIP18 family protein [Escovopsis weberi]|uniref:MIP18 family protein n=1 Tax=Escovopsis weberi TaxID=150374 RepID=A0A0N0RTX3_ESCWE|nr:MIP18 family protein [Escovopsis weberi]
MDMPKSNANPTVLSASQLPTRQRRAAPRNGPDCRYADIISQRPSFMSRPFCHQDDDGDSTGSSDEDSQLHSQASPRYTFGDGVTGDNDDDGWAAAEPIDEQEIYDLIAPLQDPEHPVSLGQLSVVNLEDIIIAPSPALGVPGPDTIVRVSVMLTPTVTHCSLATIIGLGVRLRLGQVLPPNYRIEVTCKENTHLQDEQVNKQLNDKERVAAALENETLKETMDRMLSGCLNSKTS